MANNSVDSGFDGIIEAFNEVRIESGFARQHYPSSYKGIVDAVRDLGEVLAGSSSTYLITSVQEATPDSDVTGGLWYQPSTDSLYLWNGTEWRLVITNTASTANLLLSNTATLDSTRFLPSTSGVATQADFNTWAISALESLDQNAGSGNTTVYLSATAPTNAEVGDLWFDTVNYEMFVKTDGLWRCVSVPVDEDYDFIALSNAVSAQDTLNANRFESIESSIAALPFSSYATNSYVTITKNNLESSISNLTTTVGDLNRFALASSFTSHCNSIDTRVTALENATIDFTPYATNATVTTEISNLQSQITANTAKADVSYVDTAIAGVQAAVTGAQAAIPDVSGFITDSDFTAYQTSLLNSFMPVSGGTLTGNLTLANLDTALAKLDFSNSSVSGRKALRFKSYASTDAYVDFGTTDEYWEYAFDFAGEEDFCWKHATTGKQFSVNKNGATAKNLIIADFVANDETGQRTVNAIDVKAKLSAHDTTLATHTQQITDIISGAYTNDSGVIYSDTAPTGTIDDGALWFDSQNIRLNVRHQGAWIYPDRVEDTTLKTALFNAVSTATDLDALKIKLLAALV